MYPEIRTLFLLENVGKTFYCFLFLFSWFKKHCVRKKQLNFPLFKKSFSPFALKHKKSAQKKPSFFVFVPSFFVSFFIFQHVPCFFHHFFLGSLFPFILLFIPFCFSPLFLFSPFSILYLCMCFSFSFMTEDNTRHPEK